MITCAYLKRNGTLSKCPYNKKCVVFDDDGNNITFCDQIEFTGITINKD